MFLRERHSGSWPSPETLTPSLGLASHKQNESSQPWKSLPTHPESWVVMSRHRKHRKMTQSSLTFYARDLWMFCQLCSLIVPQDPQIPRLLDSRIKANPQSQPVIYSSLPTLLSLISAASLCQTPRLFFVSITRQYKLEKPKFHSFHAARADRPWQRYNPYKRPL